VPSQAATRFDFFRLAGRVLTNEARNLIGVRRRAGTDAGRPVPCLHWENATGQKPGKAGTNNDEDRDHFRGEIYGRDARRKPVCAGPTWLPFLPLELTLDDYSDNEKITYLPRKLTDAGSGPFENGIGDLCSPPGATGLLLR